MLSPASIADNYAIGEWLGVANTNGVDEVPTSANADLATKLAGILVELYGDDAKEFAYACEYYADVFQASSDEQEDVYLFADGSCAVLVYGEGRSAGGKLQAPTGWIIDATPETAIAYAHGGAFGRNNLAGYAEALLLRLKAKAEAKAAGIAYKAIKLGDV